MTELNDIIFRQINLIGLFKNALEEFYLKDF